MSGFIENEEVDDAIHIAWPVFFWLAMVGGSALFFWTDNIALWLSVHIGT
jgi:hypothetical protein